jgi:hypothetical protein
MGVHHSTYYRWKGKVDRWGLEALRIRERRRPRMPNQIGPHLEQRIIAFSATRASGPGVSRPSFAARSGAASGSQSTGLAGAVPLWAQHPLAERSRYLRRNARHCSRCREPASAGAVMARLCAIRGTIIKGGKGTSALALADVTPASTECDRQRDQVPPAEQCSDCVDVVPSFSGRLCARWRTAPQPRAGDGYHRLLSGVNLVFHSWSVGSQRLGAPLCPRRPSGSPVPRGPL